MSASALLLEAKWTSCRALHCSDLWVHALIIGSAYPTRRRRDRREAPVGYPLRSRAGRRLLRAISMARSIAACAGFLILIHSRQRPER
jgi:hypothetical protein